MLSEQVAEPPSCERATENSSTMATWWPIVLNGTHSCPKRWGRRPTPKSLGSLPLLRRKL
jgi:hypothetical protein